MKFEILKLLEQNIGQLTKSQKKVADYIIKNPMQAAFSTIDQMANAIGTSTTTIIRLAMHFGYTGFAEFQRALQELLKSRMGPSTKLEANIKNSNSKSNIIMGIAEQQMENFKRTFDNLSDDRIFKAEKLLREADQIYVSGSRSSYAVAHYLTFNLNRIFGKCDLLSSDGGDLPEKVNRIKKNDVVVVMSMPRYVKQIVKIAKIAKDRQASVIAVTDGYLSPLGQFADILFSVECQSSDFHNSLVPAMLIADVLIGVATIKNSELAKKQLKEVENVLEDFDIHVNR